MLELKSDFYDLTVLYEQVGKNDTSLKRFVDIFLTTVPDDMQVLKDAIDWEDYDKAKSAAHKMKSSYAIMGADWAHKICSGMEEMAKNRIETEKLPDMFWELSDKFTVMVNRLKEITF
jgi:HPt (histidine-containing phosphotransfer) domain-containing protein